MTKHGREIIEVPCGFCEANWWTRERFTKGQAWVDLVLLASHNEQKKLIGGKVTTIYPGQVFTSLKSLSLRWKWGTDKVLRFIDIFTHAGWISIKKGQFGIVITINEVVKNAEDFWVV